MLLSGWFDPDDVGRDPCERWCPGEGESVCGLIPVVVGLVSLFPLSAADTD